MIRQILKPLASLRLTVALLAITMILVFAGTSIQKEMGIWDVQHRYFHSFFVWIQLRLFFPLWNWGFSHFPGKIPMLGGYSIIGLLLANLIAAHSVRFSLSRKRVGIILIHGGLILLILGEVVTSLFAVENRITIEEGQTARFSENTRECELAIIDPSPADHDNVVVIPASKLARGGTITDPAMPFSIHVEAFYPNSELLGPFQMQHSKEVPAITATAGVGARIGMVSRPGATGIDNASDFPGAFITIQAGDQSLGRYLVSTKLHDPQDVSVGQRSFRIALRWKRTYKPYAMTLIKFSHDIYPGTDVPRNFSSLIRLVDPDQHEDRQVKIWMNHPLRYAGETMYQADWNHETDRGTVLQIVRNPGWLIPYVSCITIALGLLIHFGMTLTRFLQKDRVPVIAIGSPRAGFLWPAIVTAFCLLFIVAQGRAPRHDSNFDLNAFGRVPISYGGRIMPLDSLARISLRVINNKSQPPAVDGKSRPAIEWLADVMSQRPAARAERIFRIDQPDLLSFLSLPSDRTLFSFDEIIAKAKELDDQFLRVQQLPDKQRDLFQQKLVELYGHLNVFVRLMDGSQLYLALPTSDDGDWQTLEAVNHETANPNAGLAAYVALMQSYQHDKPDDFDDAVDGYLSFFDRHFPDLGRRVRFETLFNFLDPFINCCALYIAAFLLICASWMIRPARATLQRTAMWVLLLTFAFHTLGLVARIYIQGRPPVTNLYSSAIFIGWAAVGFCLIIESIYRNTIGSFAACAIAFPTLVIAHYLAVNPVLTPGGDTMEMLRAVLDTNIWLATHVVVVTLGYTATLLAGLIAAIYIIGSVCFGAFGDSNSRKTMTSIVYGVLCFALLFSFVGTVLGGIWADQSWGRFWGWDSKENGAVLVVLWNAIVLHSRWAGLVRSDRGMMNLAVLGNIVVSWSWFGTNMLGVGLHSYGFMNSAVSWLAAVVAMHLAIFAVGLLPGKLSLTART